MKFKDIFKSSPSDGEFMNRCRTYFLDRPASLQFGKWRAWNKKTKEKYPVSWFILETIPDFFSGLWHSVENFYYHLTCKYFRRHHHIKIDVERFFDNGRKPLYRYHWLDSDTKILYGLMQILVDFVEQESDIVDWTADPKHLEIYDEFMAIYKWWTEERPNRSDVFPSSADYGLDPLEIFSEDNKKSPNYRRWHEAVMEGYKLEEEYHAEDTEMLIRFVTIRRYLWT